MTAPYTILIAHPDDELLWCWPALKNARRIVCATSDLNNPERKRYSKRRFCLEEIGRLLNLEVICFDNNSGFYRLPTRGSELKITAIEIMNRLESPVFTHNPWGEYGHLDHILCHQIAMASGHEVYCSDACIDANWLPVRRRLPAGELHHLSGEWEWLQRLKEVYDKAGCWTWYLPVPEALEVVKL